MTEEQNLKGLGGWLILVGIGVVLSPFRLAFEYYPIFSQIFTDGTWEVLTTVGSEAYNVMWAPLLIGEIVFNSLMVLVSVYLIYLFFTKHYWFPKVYIIIITIALVFIPLDAWLLKIVMPNEPMFGPDTIKELARTLVGAVIWVPYMLLSKRVKATFIEKKPSEKLDPSAEVVS